METVALTLQLPPEVLASLREQLKAEVLAELRALSSLEGSASSPWLTVEEAANRLRCKRQRIYDLLSQRKLSRHKEGGRTLVCRGEVDALVKLDAPALALSRPSGLAAGN
jgi:excisionase family DNA binding protein